MKKIFFCALTALFMLFLFSALGEIEIEGLADGDVFLSNQYLDVTTYVNGKKEECTWTFSPDYAARFSSGKKIKLNDIDKAAEVAITAYHEKSGEVKIINILVVPAAKSIQITADEKIVTDQTVFIDMTTGQKGVQLFSDVSPSGANAGVKWISSDPEIASVDENGYVTFHSKGKCEITAETVNGRKAQATVFLSYAARTIELIAPGEIAVGNSEQLFAIVTPDEAAQDGVTWTSSREKVISISETGEITAKRAGKAVITATANSGIKAEIEIEAYLPVESVEIRNTFSIKPGETEQLIVRVSPKEAKYRDVTFISLNPEIATVDNDGFVTGVSPGTVAIIASASNGVSAHRTLEVRPVKLESFVLSDYFETMLVGESAAIFPIFSPENATETSLFYETSNALVATVDENGVVTANGEGKCVITIQSERDDIASLSFRINVQRPNALPLEGIVIGINPAGQEKKSSQKLPLAPGSSKTDNAVYSGMRGVKTKTPEYMLTLEISFRLKEALESMGAEVVMTRETNDADLNNIERAQMLNDAGADISIQIQMNASDKKTQSGFSAYARYSDVESQAIGKILLEEACNASGAKMLKVNRSNNYMFLNWSEAPALLLACGFLTNADEDVNLNSPIYQQLLADGIAEGLRMYFEGN